MFTQVTRLKRLILVWVINVLKNTKNPNFISFIVYLFILYLSTLLTFQTLECLRHCIGKTVECNVYGLIRSTTSDSRWVERNYEMILDGTKILRNYSRWKERHYEMTLGERRETKIWWQMEGMKLRNYSKCKDRNYEILSLHRWCHDTYRKGQLSEYNTGFLSNSQRCGSVTLLSRTRTKYDTCVQNLNTENC
jgi:hypothetical protein